MLSKETLVSSIARVNLPATEKLSSTIQPKGVEFQKQDIQESSWTGDWFEYEADNLKEATADYEVQEPELLSEESSSDYDSSEPEYEEDVILLDPSDESWYPEADYEDECPSDYESQDEDYESEDDLSDEELIAQHQALVAHMDSKPTKRDAHKRHYVHYRVTCELDDIAEVDESLYEVQGEDVPSGDVPPNNEFPQRWVTSHTRSYYPSVDGLGITPLFWRPTELLANCREVYWDGNVRSIKGKGRRVTFSSEPFPKRMPPSSTLGGHEKDALRAERLKAYYADQTDDIGQLLPHARAYFNRLRVLEFQRTIFDAIVLNYHFLIRKVALTSNDRRFMERLKLKIIQNPSEMAFTAKRWAGVARAHWFDDRSVSLPNFLRGKPGWFLAQFSYMGRALPPPPRDQTALPAYVERLCSEPPPEHPEWRAFVRSYLTQYAPRGEVNYRTDPSTSACLGYTRKGGGFTKAVQTLVSFGVALIALHNKTTTTTRPLRTVDTKGNLDVKAVKGLFPIPLRLRIEVQKALADPKEYNENIVKNGSYLFRAVPLEDFESIGNFLVPDEKRYSLALRVAVHAILAKVKAIPLLPIYAEEKGLKARNPSMTLAAATLVYQLFRRAIDSHIFRDRHFSGGMGGPLPRKPLLKREPGSFIYSQDLSYATDYHPFWLTKTMYEEILLQPAHHQLKEWEPYFEKLFGSHQILLVRGSEIPLPPTDNVQITHRSEHAKDLCDSEGTPLSDLPGGVSEEYVAHGFWAGKTLPFRGAEYNRRFGDMLWLVSNMSEWLKKLEFLPSRYSTTGCSMGDPTSFPGMVMLTAFAAERANTDNYNGVGDDAELEFVLQSQREIYDNTVKACGGTLSTGDPKKGKPNKIYQHPTKSILCEELRNRGRLLRTQHMSLWSAPPGGSKGHIDWYNQPSSARQHLEDQGVPVYAGLWTKTCTFNSVLAAFRLGIPVGASVTYGGVGHPLLPPQAGTVNHHNWAWLSALSRLTLYQLSTGTGLSPLPTGISGVARSVISRHIDEIANQTLLPIYRQALGDSPVTTTQRVTTSLDGKEVINPSFTEACDMMLGLVTSWEAYHRQAPEVIRTPKIAVVASKLKRRIRPHLKSLYVAFDYHKTMDDLVRKTNVFLDHRVDLVPFNWDERAYGLRSNSLKGDRSRRFAQQWEHLTRFRIDRAYLNPVMTTLKVQDETEELAPSG